MAKEEQTSVPISKLGKHERVLFRQFNSARTDDDALRVVNDPDFPVHALNPVSFSPLMIAAESGYSKTVEALVKQKKAPLDYQITYGLQRGRTALHIAARRTNLEVVKTLIDAGASLDLQDVSKQTALHVASVWGHSDIAMALIDAGASLELQDDKGKTPLHEAVIGDKPDLALYMIEKGAPLGIQDGNKDAPLHNISDRCAPNRVGVAMVERIKADGNLEYLNLQDNYECTPLHWAVGGGYEQYAKALIDAGARMDIYDSSNSLVLDDACESGLDDVSEYMVKQGATIGSEAKNIQHPLTVCFEKGLAKTALALLEEMRPEDLPKRYLPDEDTNISRNEIFKHSRMHKAVLGLIKKGMPLDIDDYQHSMTANNEFKDMNRQFVRHVILPYAIRKYPHLAKDMVFKDGVTSTTEIFVDQMSKDLSDTIFPSPHSKDLEEVVDEVARINKHNKQFPNETKSLDEYLNNNPTIRHFFWPTRLSNTWHHPAINIPREYLPLSGIGEWAPILEQPFAPDGPKGLTITNLTSGEDLRYESHILDHCVGKHSGYDKKCMREEHHSRSHILSIGSIGPNGARMPISTVEMKIVPNDEQNSELIPIFRNDTYSLLIEQHQGPNNTTPTDKAQRLLNTFLAGVRDGSVTIETDNKKLGETQDSVQQREQYSLLEQEMGMPLSWVTDPKSEGYENLGAIFDRFRMSERAAMTGIDQRGQRIYDIERTDDRYTHFNHFIDGWAKIDANGKPKDKMALRKKDLKIDAGEMAVSLRDLDLKSWLQATGLDQKIDDRLKNFFPEYEYGSPDEGINLDRRPIPQERGSHINRAMVITHQGTVKPAPHELSAA